MRLLLLIALAVPIAAHAELVTVRGLGGMDLSTFNCAVIREAHFSVASATMKPVIICLPRSEKSITSLAASAQSRSMD